MDRELTDAETEVTDLFFELMGDPDLHKDEAARTALTAMPTRWISPEFVLWMTDGRLTSVDGVVLSVRHLDDDTHPLTRELR